MGKSITGFTIIEILCALLIIAALTLQAIPSFKDFWIQNHTAVTTNDIVAALNIAKSEAIKLGQRVYFCTTSNEKTCDNNDDWSLNRAIISEQKELLRIYPNLVNGDKLFLKGTLGKNNFISFNSLGLSSGQATTLIYCPYGQKSKAITIVLNQLGRIRVEKNPSKDEKSFCPN